MSVTGFVIWEEGGRNQQDFNNKINKYKMKVSQQPLADDFWPQKIDNIK